MATPPCQGMSTVGPQEKGDERNNLIVPTIELIKKVSPKYVFIENVPLFLNTLIEFNGKEISISDLIKKSLISEYQIEFYVIDTKDYSVPQSRERAIVLLSRRDQKNKWIMPETHETIITMRDAIGDIPIIDPFIKDVSENELLEVFPQFYNRKSTALKISKWNNPPHHVKRQVITMTHTPTGCSAFENEVFKPVKENGNYIRGFPNTYKRQNWDSAAYTITMDNRKISSQNNVHPGRFLGTDSDGHDIYSDARALTLYEIMKIMTIPDDWPIPSNTSEAFLRRVIGEGIPPLFVKQVFEKIPINDL